MTDNELVLKNWEWDEEGYSICPGCHESMVWDKSILFIPNHPPDCEFVSSVAKMSLELLKSWLVFSQGTGGEVRDQTQKLLGNLPGFDWRRREDGERMKTLAPEPLGVEKYDDQIEEIIAICAQAGYEVSVNDARIIWGDYSQMTSGQINHWEPIPTTLNKEYKILAVMLAFSQEMNDPVYPQGLPGDDDEEK